MRYHDGLEKIRRVLSQQTAPRPSPDVLPKGLNLNAFVSSGLNEEDCTKILAENGYKPIESLVPQEGLFQLFVPDGQKGWEYMVFQDGKMQSFATMGWGYFAVQTNVPGKEGEKGFYRLNYEMQAFLGEIWKSGVATYLETQRKSAQEVRLKMARIPWEDRFSQTVEALRTACNDASKDFSVPRFASAKTDELLPCEAQRSGLYRRLPDVRVTL